MATKAKKAESTMVRIDSIIRDHEYLPRRSITPDNDTVELYREVLVESGWTFDPVTLQRLPDDQFRLLDGLHRIAAAEGEEQVEVPADIKDCTDDEAFEIACRANQKHGKQLTPADRRHMIQSALNRAGKKASGQVLSDLTGIPRSTCLALKREVLGMFSDETVVDDKVVQVSSGPSLFDDEPDDIEQSSNGAEPPDVPFDNAAASVDNGDAEADDEPDWTFDKLRDWHVAAVNELNRMMRTLNEISESANGEYIRHVTARVSKLLKDAKATIRQMQPMEEVDGRIVTRMDQRSEA